MRLLKSIRPDPERTRFEMEAGRRQVQKNTEADMLAEIGRLKREQETRIKDLEDEIAIVKGSCRTDTDDEM